ncbi:MAG: hypothetical protein R3324_16000, partial [Halobacteriales archaeon]|nr:hypothetical protein [Halobacteriales archaeon]
PSAPSLVNDAGQTILAADLTKRWTFRGGPTRQDIYRTFTTGLNGTPMPSYADSLTDEQRWQLVDYVYSLGDSDEPNYAEQLVSKNLEDELDLARGEALFEEAESAFFPLFGQIVEPGRAFHPTTTGIEVKAVHNQDEIAFLLQWHDMRADTSGENGPDLSTSATAQPAKAVPEDEAEAATNEADPFADAVESEVDAGDDFWGDATGSGDEGQAGEAGEETAGDDFWNDATEEGDTTDDFFSTEPDEEVSTGDEAVFSDAVAVQLPSLAPDDIRLPYFIFGDLDNPVDIWFADLAKDGPQLFEGRGSANLSAETPDCLEMSAVYDAGEWTVIFKRDRRAEDAMAIEDDQWYPIAYSVWDGWNDDRGNKRASVHGGVAGTGGIRVIAG